MRTTTFIMTLALAASLAACGGDKKSSAPAGSTDALVAKLKGAGLSAGEMTAVDVPKLGGAKCKRGDIGGVEVTICEYTDESRAKKYESEGLNLVGDTTGASLANGKLLLVVADRQNVDKDGKRINQITRAFEGK
jgi:hypothetical protein